jgi:energy-coupling factor transport system ATP-binding protein
MLLQVNNLQYRYPRQKEYILDGLNLEMKRGECISITGGNGSGKSTLISVLSGLAASFRGGELFGLIQLPGGGKFRPACVLQEPDSQILCDKVGEELAFFMNYSSQSGDPSALEEAVDRLGIKELQDRKVFELSYGEKQRLILTGGIICGDKELILLDEPSAYLDEDGVERLFGILTRLKSSGSAIIIIGHDFQRIESIIDRRYLMRNGRLSPLLLSQTEDLLYKELPRVKDIRTESVFSVSDLAFHSPEGKVIFSGFSREFHRGVAYGIIGPNGAGKTTLARVLSGISGFSEGEITRSGKKLDDRARRRIVGMVHQNPFHQMLYRTVDRNLRSAFRNRLSEPVISLNEGVERLGLARLLGREVTSLSIGEAQRVALLCAILHGPEMLIIDESLAGLDPEGVNAVRELILFLREKDKCILLISHLKKFIDLFCDVQIPLNSSIGSMNSRENI